MSVTIIQQRLLDYQCEHVGEQDNALKEIAQEIALMSLSRSDFFRIAAFQGGTCLRILYGLARYSEDLDFVLLAPDASFDWSPYLKSMQEDFKTYGYTLEVKNKSTVNKAVKTTFLKADSLGGLLVLKDLRSNRPKLQIKLEIDANPPLGSNYELKYLDFPLPFSIQSQDMPSLFAGKCHALLCRNFVKGRDWYDFVWYVARQCSINFPLLEQALNQSGPWQNQQQIISPDWLLTELKTKIISIDWQAAKKDVQRFLRANELESLNVWSEAFFLSRLEKLATIL